jgi:hypothetical protein
VTAGINAEGGSTGTTIANNISVDNGIGSPRTHSDIRIEQGSTAGTTVDYDLVHLTTSDTLLIWNSVSYKSLAAFQAASGQEAHGIDADPRWRAPGGGDFHLTAGSPAIDSADSGVAGEPATDVEGNPRVDDPGTADTGAGPSTDYDRGAYEFQGTTPNQPPSAALTVRPASGVAPLPVTADASASTAGGTNPIASYSLDRDRERHRHRPRFPAVRREPGLRDRPHRVEHVRLQHGGRADTVERRALRELVGAGLQHDDCQRGHLPVERLAELGEDDRRRHLHRIHVGAGGCARRGGEAPVP